MMGPLINYVYVYCSNTVNEYMEFRISPYGINGSRWLPSYGLLLVASLPNYKEATTETHSYPLAQR